MSLNQAMWISVSTSLPAVRALAPGVQAMPRTPEDRQKQCLGMQGMNCQGTCFGLQATGFFEGSKCDNW